MLILLLEMRNRDSQKMLKYLQDKDILKGNLMLLKTRFSHLKYLTLKCIISTWGQVKGYSTQSLSLLFSLECALPILSQQHWMDICGALISANVNISCFRDRNLWREVAGHSRHISVNDQR